MDDLELTITLLTTTVIILSVVVVAVLIVLTIVLIKLRQVAKHVESVTNSVATAVSFLHPVTWIQGIKSIIKKRG